MPPQVVGLLLVEEPTVGIVATETVVAPGLDLHPFPEVAITLYVPEAASVTLVIEGF